jgi:hypothetical protein
MALALALALGPAAALLAPADDGAPVTSAVGRPAMALPLAVGSTLGVGSTLACAAALALGVPD